MLRLPEYLAEHQNAYDYFQEEIASNAQNNEVRQFIHNLIMQAPYRISAIFDRLEDIVELKLLFESSNADIAKKNLQTLDWILSNLELAPFKINIINTLEESEIFTPESHTAILELLQTNLKFKLDLNIIKNCLRELQLNDILHKENNGQKILHKLVLNINYAHAISSCIVNLHNQNLLTQSSLELMLNNFEYTVCFINDNYFNDKFQTEQRLNFFKEVISQKDIPLQIITLYEEYCKRNIEELNKIGLGGKESAMETSLVVKSKNFYKNKVRPAYKEIFESHYHDSLLVIEREIKELILDEIYANTDSYYHKDFITAHKESLLLGNNEFINMMAQNTFTSNDNIYEIAWRAYNYQTSNSVNPNLLVSPNYENQDDPIYSTAESSDRPLNQASASFIIRKMAALYYLSAIDTVGDAAASVNERKKAFITYIAEIQRGNNDNVEEEDNPSCFPGAITRLACIADNHPRFKESLSIKEIINNKIKALIVNAFTEKLASFESLSSKRAFLTSMIYMHHNDFEEFLSNPRPILNLVNTQPTTLKITSKLRSSFLYIILTKISFHNSIIEHLSELAKEGQIPAITVNKEFMQLILEQLELNICKLNTAEYATPFIDIFRINTQKQRQPAKNTKKRKIDFFQEISIEQARDKFKALTALSPARLNILIAKEVITSRTQIYLYKLLLDSLGDSISEFLQTFVVQAVTKSYSEITIDDGNNIDYTLVETEIHSKLKQIKAEDIIAENIDEFAAFQDVIDPTLLQNINHKVANGKSYHS